MCGYFPGKRLGWLEDTPAGVVKDWCGLSTRFERLPSARTLTTLPFSLATAKTLAISLSDDHFAFFHSRFQSTLWPLALQWLRHGELAEGMPGRVISQQP